MMQSSLGLQSRKFRRRNSVEKMKTLKRMVVVACDTPCPFRLYTVVIIISIC